MKTIESIYNSEKFGKTELRKIRGGVKVTDTNNTTNAPRRLNGVVSAIITNDGDDDTD